MKLLILSTTVLILFIFSSCAKDTEYDIDCLKQEYQPGWKTIALNNELSIQFPDSAVGDGYGDHDNTGIFSFNMQIGNPGFFIRLTNTTFSIPTSDTLTAYNQSISPVSINVGSPTGTTIEQIPYNNQIYLCNNGQVIGVFAYGEYYEPSIFFDNDYLVGKLYLKDSDNSPVFRNKISRIFFKRDRLELTTDILRTIYQKDPK